MAYLSDYFAGTVTSSGLVITGTGTGWQTAQFREGDIFIADGWWARVASVDSNTQITIDANGGSIGGALSGAPYRLRYMSDGSRSSAQARQLIDVLGSSGNLEALGGLAGLPDNVIMFTGPGTMALIPRTELVAGITYDVQVNTLADRAAYNGQPVGFTVLVSDTGDGRSAVYSRVGASGNWSDPAYVTGPVGPLPTVGVGTTSTLAPGSDATVTSTPVTGGVNLNFGIPAGRGFTNRGAYSGATAYVIGDVVSYNGSSYIATAETTGNLPTNAAFWDLLAAKGTDGTGTGDVTGPSTSVNNEIALFSGTTGKLLDRGPVLGTVGRNVAASVDRSTLRTAALLDTFPVASGLNANALPAKSDVYISANWVNAPATSGAMRREVHTENFIIDTFTQFTASGPRMWIRSINGGDTAGFLEIASYIEVIAGDQNANNYSSRSGVFSANWASNVPPGFAYGILGVIFHSVGYALQSFQPWGSNREFIRQLNGGTWLPWSEVYNRGNILGTVSQTSGVPTGAIIEQGSNANGQYTRFADGTMICRRHWTGGGTSGSTFTFVLSFSSTFAAAPSLVMGGVCANGSNSNYVNATINIGDVTTTTANITAWAISGSVDRIVDASYIAVGRWF